MWTGTSGVPASKDGHGRKRATTTIRVLAEAHASINGVGELGGAKGSIHRAHAADDPDAEVKLNRQHSGPTEPNTETKEGFGL